jgi:hypothetical protein
MSPTMGFSAGVWVLPCDSARGRFWRHVSKSAENFWRRSLRQSL